jgi:serine/threonine-protein kinase HipA
MSDGRDQVAVYLDAVDHQPTRRVGVLARERSRSTSVIAFAYDRAWLARRDAFEIDPSLRLHEGDQHVAALPGVFGDAAPDRWGRMLMERREALIARRESRRPRRLDDWDFLVGVQDTSRMGALRLQRAGAFVADEPLSIPPSTELRTLEHWARQLEVGLPESQTDNDRWVAMLLAPGSSLGGARPKANFRGEDESLWIAKFPSREDRHDIGAWESVVHRLASLAGVTVSDARLLTLSSDYRTFCARRFDRAGGGRRLYASAMTLTGRNDHEQASYLDILEAIERFGARNSIAQDLEQLFRRVVFNVLTADRDDHLRNHGFLRTPLGWRLSPAFDMNPTPERHEHSLTLDGSVRLPDVEVVRDTATFYRLSAERADSIIGEVRDTVRHWRSVARETEIVRDEIERMEDAFALA